MLLFYSFILGEEGELYIVRMVVAVAYASAHPPLALTGLKRPHNPFTVDWHCFGWTTWVMQGQGSYSFMSVNFIFVCHVYFFQILFFLIIFIVFLFRNQSFFFLLSLSYIYLFIIFLLILNQGSFFFFFSFLVVCQCLTSELKPGVAPTTATCV